MIRGRCPICARSYEIAAIDALPSFPFCSDRCRMVDLGRWIDGKYVIPRSTNAERPQDGEDKSSQDDED